MASIKDVAKKANVGVGTVSRYLNTPELVSKKSQIKIGEAIQELGYYPNEVGRNLKTNNSRNIAFIVPSIWHPFFSGLAFYIEDFLDQKGYKLMLCNTNNQPEKELYYLDMLKQNKVSGILAISYSNIDRYIQKDLPIVSFERHFKNEISCVTSDNFHGGELACDLLIEIGKKNFMYVGTYNHKIEIEVKYRKEGFLARAKERNYQAEAFIEEDPIKDYDSFIERFFAIYGNVVDGVFVENDNLAMHLIKKAMEKGFRVPEDIAVIGYDGVMQNEFFEPSLTTVVQPLQEMAKEAVDLVIRMIEEGPITQKIVIPVTMRRGKSA